MRTPCSIGGFVKSFTYLSTDPWQRVSDEHVYHAGAAEPGVHHDHARRILANLADESRHSLYETFRSSLSAIQTLIMD